MNYADYNFNPTPTSNELFGMFTQPTSAVAPPNAVPQGDRPLGFSPALEQQRSRSPGAPQE